MFDPFLAPKQVRFLLKCNGEGNVVEMIEWSRSNLRDRWNSSGPFVGAILDSFYFWFHDELDFDLFRMKFGGRAIQTL